MSVSRGPPHRKDIRVEGRHSGFTPTAARPCILGLVVRQTPGEVDRFDLEAGRAGFLPPPPPTREPMAPAVWESGDR